jgi:hypothetical protein
LRDADFLHLWADRRAAERRLDRGSAHGLFDTHAQLWRHDSLLFATAEQPCWFC